MDRHLAQAERWIDEAGFAAELSALLPRGGRPRQLPVRTLFLGIMLLALDGQPLYLRWALERLLALPPATRKRLRIDVPDRFGRTHELTYRQVTHQFGRVMELLDPQPLAFPKGVTPERRAETVARRLLDPSEQGHREARLRHVGWLLLA